MGLKLNPKNLLIIVVYALISAPELALANEACMVLNNQLMGDCTDDDYCAFDSRTYEQNCRSAVQKRAQSEQKRQEELAVRASRKMQDALSSVEGNCNTDPRTLTGGADVIEIVPIAAREGEEARCRFYFKAN